MSRPLLALATFCVCALAAAGLYSWSEHRAAERAPLPVSTVERLITPNPLTIAKTGVALPPEPDRAGVQRHIHLAVRFVTDGVTVYPPREVGLAQGRGFLAIHTHDRSGVVHVHQPTFDDDLRLSSVWAAWGLRVSAGSFAGASPACIYVDGKPVEGDPALRDLMDVQVSFARCTASAPLPAFDFNSAEFVRSAKRYK
jgi:hypothetical protein